MPKKDKVKAEIDADIQAELDDSDSWQDQVLVLLIAILRELKKPGGPQ